MKIENINLEFFAVRNEKGQWFRRKGYGGYGDSWVSDIKKARIYNKIGGARTTVTFFAGNYKDYKTPDIVKFAVSAVEVINEADRVQKALNKKEKEKVAQEIRKREHEIEMAKKAKKQAEEKLRKLKS